MSWVIQTTEENRNTGIKIDDFVIDFKGVFIYKDKDPTYIISISVQIKISYTIVNYQNYIY